MKYILIYKSICKVLHELLNKLIRMQGICVYSVMYGKVEGVVEGVGGVVGQK